MKTFKFFVFAFCFASAPVFGQSDTPCSFNQVGQDKYVLNQNFSSDGFDHTILYVGLDTPEESEFGLTFRCDENNVFDVSNMKGYDFVTSDDMTEYGILQVQMFAVARSRDGKEAKIVKKKYVCESRGNDIAVGVNQLLN